MSCGDNQCVFVSFSARTVTNAWLAREKCRAVATPRGSRRVHCTYLSSSPICVEHPSKSFRHHYYSVLYRRQSKSRPPHCLPLRSSFHPPLTSVCHHVSLLTGYFDSRDDCTVNGKGIRPLAEAHSHLHRTLVQCQWISGRRRSCGTSNRLEGRRSRRLLSIVCSQ